MTRQEYQEYIETIKALEKIKSDIADNFTRICRYHEIKEEVLYYAEQNIENIFNWMIEFYKQALLEGDTSKKALMIGMAHTISDLNVPILTSWVHQSPIEFLFYSMLNHSMPSHIWRRAFLMPQVPVCDGKYILDFALMDRRDSQIDGTEGVPIIGIECDGYHYHYSDPVKTTKTLERVRNISMTTGIKIFSYTGKEIYKNCAKLASTFWEYVDQHIYPSIY
jgi:hypothetical protein